jgi:hypothetical protein
MAGEATVRALREVARVPALEWAALREATRAAKEGAGEAEAALRDALRQRCAAVEHATALAWLEAASLLDPALALEAARAVPLRVALPREARAKLWARVLGARVDAEGFDGAVAAACARWRLSDPERCQIHSLLGRVADRACALAECDAAVAARARAALNVFYVYCERFGLQLSLMAVHLAEALPDAGPRELARALAAASKSLPQPAERAAAAAAAMRALASRDAALHEHVARAFARDAPPLLASQQPPAPLPPLSERGDLGSGLGARGFALPLRATHLFERWLASAFVGFLERRVAAWLWDALLLRGGDLAALQALCVEVAVAAREALLAAESLEQLDAAFVDAPRRLRPAQLVAAAERAGFR